MRWPSRQLFLTEERLAALAERCRPAFVAECEAMRIDNDLSALLESLYLPLAAWLRENRGDADSTRVVGVCGAQGSGKSTFCRLLGRVMGEAFDEPAVTLSIDDVYETRERREQLAAAIHPLFATRGVPGTHDVALGLASIQRLACLAEGESVALPVFDKAMDTRLAPDRWRSQRGPVGTVLFEGWCVGAVPESEAALRDPINSLEREEDADGVWRRAVNERLGGDYQRLFALIDVLILLRVDGMHRVFEWRRLQEHKLAAAAAADANTRIMSDLQVNRFIMHYERLTRHILSEMPARADIVFDLDESHSAAAVHINNPVGGAL
ncbi:MAG: kinase [Gammaproteobacteria bacterium]|nr:MAG: kinase [Gammaproteobacteria bacterium]